MGGRTQGAGRCILPVPKGAEYSDSGIHGWTPSDAGHMCCGAVDTNTTFSAEFQCEPDYNGDVEIEAVASRGGTNHFATAQFACREE